MTLLAARLSDSTGCRNRTRHTLCHRRLVRHTCDVGNVNHSPSPPHDCHVSQCVPSGHCLIQRHTTQRKACHPPVVLFTLSFHCFVLSIFRSFILYIFYSFVCLLIFPLFFYTLCHSFTICSVFISFFSLFV